MKKTVSLFLTVLMALSVITVAGTASAVETARVNDVECKVGATVTYTYDIKAPGVAEDFQGQLDYSEGLKLVSFQLSETAGSPIFNTEYSGVVYYNCSSPYGDYDFREGKTLITAQFQVTAGGDQKVENKMFIISGADGTDYYSRGVNNGCTESEKVVADFIPVESVTLNKTAASIATGNTETLVAVVNPEYATNTDVVWSTSNDSVATVNGGVVTAVAPGKAVITAECGDKSAKCEVTVADSIINVTAIAVAPSAASVSVGKTRALSATVTPADATVTDVEWSSSNTGVATVDEKGVVTGVKKGTAEITATAKDGSGVAGTARITVTQPVTKITLAKTATVNVKKTVALKASVAPSNADNRTLTWTSANSKIAKVNAKGVVTGVKKGTVNIKAAAKDGSGKYAVCKVTVKQPVTKIVLKKGSKNVTNKTVKVKKGSKTKLKVKVTPTNANKKTVKWASSKKKVASVTQKGVVKARKKGTAVIKVTAKDGSKKTAKCKIKVK